MSKSTKKDLTKARQNALAFGSDTILFTDLEVNETFCIAGAEFSGVYRKVRRNRYRHMGMLCFARDHMPVKRVQLPRRHSFKT
jgi:hypothetical protein